MPSLEQLQQSFADCVTSPDGPAADELRLFQFPERLRVYRNNYRFALRQTLSDTFRHTREYLSDELFQSLANQYIRLHPSEDWSLNGYGHDFADWIRCNVTSGSRPELPPAAADVAQLDWCRHACYYAPDCPPVSGGDFAALALEQQLSSLFQTAPPVRLLRSSWDLAALTGCPIERMPDLDDQPPHHYLVARKEGIPRIHQVNPSVWALVSALRQPDSLQAIIKQHPEAAGQLPHILQQGWVLVQPRD